MRVQMDDNEVVFTDAIFDQSSPEWQPHPELGLIFLRCQESYANDKLRSNKVLFLNEVLEMLGLPRTKQGQVIGWLDDGSGDRRISFCLPAEANATGIYNLKFNVDGIVFEHLTANV